MLRGWLNFAGVLALAGLPPILASVPQTGVRSDSGGGGGGIADVVDDTTPQLGGNLDLNDFYITDSSSSNEFGVDLDADGTPEILWDGTDLAFDPDDDGTPEFAWCNETTCGVGAALEFGVSGSIPLLTSASHWTNTANGDFTIQVTGEVRLEDTAGGVDQAKLDYDKIAATGNETAFQWYATVNKATSGDFTAWAIDVTDTSSPDALHLSEWAVGGVVKAYVNEDGTVDSDTGFSVGAVAGSTDSTSWWLCTAADCSTKCQVTVSGGLITGCS